MLNATAQCPENIDFETGTLDKWQCKVGVAASDGTTNTISLVDSDPIFGRHQIISAASGVQKDLYGNFPTLCPYGSGYSVKLGNDNTGGEAEGISYTFTIPLNVDTLTFTYFYAVVFQDPRHAEHEQPRFFVTAYDVLTGEVINCASYDYVSTASLPGFHVSKVNGEVLYKDWSPVSLQFFGLNGRDVRLEFRTADCTLGGHFGYAYLDVGTGCSNILATAPYCLETNSLILNAPYGFKDYTWYNQDYSNVVGTGQTITFSPPPANIGTYFVDMVPYPGFGCRDTASATVQPLPVPPIPVTDTNIFCQFQLPEVMTATALPGNELLWYMDEFGGLPLETAPTIATHTRDTIHYYVSQKKLFGCESFRAKQSAIIRPTPAAGFNINDPVQCQDANLFQFQNVSANLANAEFIWDYGDGKTDTTRTIGSSHSYKDFGVYQVRLKVSNDGVCSAETGATVNVVPRPVAQFDAPAVICDQDDNIALIDKSIVPNGMGNIGGWSWKIDGVKYSIQNIGAYKAAHGGSLPIEFAVTSTDGCISDTIHRELLIRHRPSSSFSFDSRLCENEIVYLTDSSHIPSAMQDEHIVKWNWDFGPAGTSDKQHPHVKFADGNYTVKLTTETNFGCVSDEQVKMLQVNPKPGFDLTINDSCVFKSITYSAKDLNNDIVAWYWDFGNGLKQGANFSRSIFSREGDQSFVLMAETAHGCRDTLNRRFAIYDNDSFAGEDTLVARGQPVQLNAAGGASTFYKWSPADGLSSGSIEKPVAILDRDIEYTLFSVTDKGCEKTSKIFIKRYAGAEIYLPNAFTPNRDGKNDKLKVFPIGFRKFDYLAVYNRYGQKVFYTSDWNAGWDGTFNGLKQDAGNYVVVAQMVDYNGKVMMRKGNVLLVR